MCSSDLMEAAFREGRFEAGAISGLRDITALLARHFPARAENPDELPNQPVNGLTFQNIAFGFTVGSLASTDARYNSVALGSNTTLNLQAGTLEGDASGLLTLDFIQPISDLTFDLARLTSQNLTGATVSLFDSSLTGFASTPVSVSKLVTFSEGQFAYHGGTPVKRAVVSFTPAGGPRFAIDNLNTTVVPEPGTALFGAFVASVCATARTRAGRR